MKDVVQVNYIIVKSQIPTLNPGFWFWNWAVMEEKWIFFKRNFFIFLLILDKTFKNHVKICGQNKNWKKTLLKLLANKNKINFRVDFRYYTQSTIFWASDPSLLIHTYKQVEMWSKARTMISTCSQDHVQLHSGKPDCEDICQKRLKSMGFLIFLFSLIERVLLTEEKI